MGNFDAELDEALAKAEAQVEKDVLFHRAKKYGKYYKLLDSGKKEKATQYLAEMLKYDYCRGSYCCPRCGVVLLVSDMPKKDYVCLPCERYYYEEDLQDLHEMVRDETDEEKINRITEEFLRILDGANNATH